MATPQASFELLPDIAESMTAAGRHLSDGNGCGCPAWEASVNPDAAHVAHAADCPIGIVDDVFGSFAVFMPVISQSLETGGDPDVVWSRAETSLQYLPAEHLARGCVALTLALAGVLRIALAVDLTHDSRTHDLHSPEIERFAVLDMATRSPEIDLGAETALRLLLSPRPLVDLARMIDQLSSNGADPELADFPLHRLMVSLMLTINAFANEMTGGQGDQDLFALDALASEGVNLLAGMVTMVQVSTEPTDPAEGREQPETGSQG